MRSGARRSPRRRTATPGRDDNREKDQKCEIVGDETDRAYLLATRPKARPQSKTFHSCTDEGPRLSSKGRTSGSSDCRAGGETRLLLRSRADDFPASEVKPPAAPLFVQPSSVSFCSCVSASATWSFNYPGRLMQ